jgi:hypothetical protein
MSMKRLLAVAAAGVAALVTASLALGAGTGGVGAPSIYVDGTLYRTVGTPTDFSGTGAPSSSFETLYSLGDVQPKVATAAPGDAGFRGGRWQVHALAFDTSYAATVAAHDTNGSGDLDSAAEIEAALADPGPGGATDTGVVQSFECPVIPAH